MCLIAKSNRIYTASKDIPIFKVCADSLYLENKTTVCSYFRGYTFVLGERTERVTIICEPYGPYYSVDKGYHAFQTLKEAKLFCRRRIFLKTHHHEIVIVRGIIPKGVKYKRGIDDKIVAEIIVLQQIL